VLNGIVSAWPEPPDYDFPLLTAMAAVAGAANTEGKQDGWISLVLHPESGIFATVVGIGERVAAVHLPPRILEPESEMVELLSDPQCSPELAQRQHESITAWVEDYFRGAPEPIKTWIESTRQTTQSALSRIADVFFGRWGEDSEVARRCLRSTNRLWDLFEGDRKLFETFVAFGILRNSDVLLPSNEAVLSMKGWNAGEALRAAIEIQGKGVSLVRNDQGTFQWLV
jgi:hypothetical protein